MVGIPDDVFKSRTAPDLEQDRSDLQRPWFLRSMRVVIADTSPINYLVQIDAIDALLMQRREQSLRK